MTEKKNNQANRPASNENKDTGGETPKMVLVPDGFTEKLHTRSSQGPKAPKLPSNLPDGFTEKLKNQPQTGEKAPAGQNRGRRRPMAQISKTPQQPPNNQAAPQPAAPKKPAAPHQAPKKPGAAGTQQPAHKRQPQPPKATNTNPQPPKAPDTQSPLPKQGEKRRTPRRPAKAPQAQAPASAAQAAPAAASGAARDNSAQRPRRGNGRNSRVGDVKLMENTTLTPATDAMKMTKRTRPVQLAPGRPSLKIISLGGLGEIGKNITLYECEDDILIVDCGLAFPDDDLLGVDIVIPDFTYLERNREKIRGVFITHGHEDHIGSLAYLLKKINIPVFGTALTLGLIEGKIREHGLVGKVKLNVVKPGDTIRAGHMAVEFIHVNHSIPDACALAVHTPDGVVIQTGDYKIDYTPIQGDVIDLARFGELGSQGVLALLADSTNAEKPGSTPSERIVGESFDKLFTNAGKKRIIIATFASNIHRIQQIIDTAVKTGRKVAVFGRSMLNVVGVATELGYLTVKPGTIIDIDQMHSFSDEQLVVVCTGSQGEPMSALTRMSTGDHRKVHIGPNDYIILSATPIPGNEKLVGKVVNELMKQGADVIYERMYDVHVSGHACQDETKMILSLTRPKYFVPVHGEYKHLMKNAGVARSMGFDDKNIIISDIGKVIETDGLTMKLAGMVPSGRVMVDGLGVGDVGSVVLRDRKLLSEEGLIIAVVAIDSASGEVVAGPDLVSRGFVYVRENEEIMTGARDVVLNSLDKCKLTGFRDWSSIKGKIRDELSEFIYTRTKRRPMILPVIEEV